MHVWCRRRASRQPQVTEVSSPGGSTIDPQRFRVLVDLVRFEQNGPLKNQTLLKTQSCRSDRSDTSEGLLYTYVHSHASHGVLNFGCKLNISRARPESSTISNPK